MSSSSKIEKVNLMLFLYNTILPSNKNYQTILGEKTTWMNLQKKKNLEQNKSQIQMRVYVRLIYIKLKNKRNLPIVLDSGEELL